MPRLLALLMSLFLLLLLATGHSVPGQSRVYYSTAEDTNELAATPIWVELVPQPLMVATIAQFQKDEQQLANLVTISEEEFEYLLSLQDENGIIAQTPAKDEVIPYFANMAALAMLSNSRGHEPVRRYMEWYIASINRPDKLGMIGTIYDYRKENGAWLATYTYDSADSYAATFLTLSLNYALATGDMAFVATNIQSILEIAEVLIKLQDKDGLMWAKPRYYVKFLMDNAENYRGLRDMELLMNALGRGDLAERYGQSALRVSQGIEDRLWMEDKQIYAWALYGRWWQCVPKMKWYPDTVGQIYPVVFGVVDPQSERASHLYAYLNVHYPEWTKGRFDDRFPWTVLALVATMMNDDARAVEYLHNVYDSTASRSRGYPWYSFESAFFVKAWNTLGARYVLSTVTQTEDEEMIDEEAATGETDPQETLETLMVQPAGADEKASPPRGDATPGR